MRKVIILLVCQNLSDYKQPNSPTFWETIEGYYRDGWTIYIINAFEKCIENEDREKYIYTEFPVPFVKGGGIKKIGWLFRLLRFRQMKRLYIKYFNQIIMGEKLDSCLVYSYEVWTVSAGRHLSHKYNLPFVTRFQGTSMYDKKITIGNRMRYFPHFGALETKSDMVIMTNDGTKGEEFLRKIKNKTEKILFLRNGVDVASNVYVEPPFVSQVQEDEKIMLTLSRLASWKRIDRAIVALKEIIKKYPKCKLVIAGYGDEKHNLEKLACELGVNDHVIFTGEVAHDMVFSYISRADIFLSLYDMSNVGNPLMEAMRCGKPIITLDTGDTRSVIENDRNGILLSVNDVDKIPEKVIRLFEDEKYAQQLGAEAKRFATENFWTWEERVNKEVSEVNKLIERREEK